MPISAYTNYSSLEGCEKNIEVLEEYLRTWTSDTKISINLG
jgi:hypothetical protein